MIFSVKVRSRAARISLEAIFSAVGFFCDADLFPALLAVHVQVNSNESRFFPWQGLCLNGIELKRLQFPPPDNTITFIIRTQGETPVKIRRDLRDYTLVPTLK